MPSCRPDVISGVLYKVMDMAPRTILDVGVGYGKWGVLCTEYLTYWKNITPVVDGVEVFEKYKSPAHGVYREVFYTSVMDVLDKVGEYDLVLIVDVIEHLDREDGLKLLEAVKGHYIVSTPGYWSPQVASFGNIHERHVSQWKREDFVSSCVVPDQVGRNHILGWK